LISVELIGKFFLDRFAMYSQENLDAHTSGKCDYFLNNLSRIGEVCDERSIVFVVGSQQARSLLIPREVSSRVTYADEERFVRKRLSEKAASL
jgi:hypothetical protein